MTKCVVVLTFLSLLVRDGASDPPVANVHLSCSMEAEDIYFCPKSSYYFRCDVIKCSHLKWEVSGSVVQTIFPYTPTSDVVPRDPLNILIQNISRGDIEEETNFTSYLWFNSSSYPPEGSSTTVQITCRSLQSSKTINLRHPGVVERPFNVDVNAVMNDSAAEVAGQCGWRYTGDLTMVAFFDVKVLVDEEEVVNIRVPSNTQQVFFRTEKGSTYSVSVAAVDHCNAYETSESYQFMPRDVQAILQDENVTCGINVEKQPHLIFMWAIILYSLFDFVK